ncbi:Helix-turn-helix domain-containing protein [Sinosporangium album]|uniref:Helix-turn-helix domain-containing protein n=1 Tax=Sinosporangium album TaxID=504805 RepID=A0A1G8F413_9ACTN|nr:helix-turn-helix transcriptional regulator [Sinosporangium album]SDH76817.1 Helix-turn-helix domain-containing protein [Sinosporangium album]
MPAPRTLDPNASRAAAFGAELRRRRTEAQLTQDELGLRAGYSGSQVGAVEVGKRSPTPEFIGGCEKALGPGIREFWASLSGHRDKAPRWFTPWMTEEEQASAIITWEPLVVPGLLQTESYARALLKAERRYGEEEIQALVEARLARQQILTRTKPPRYLVLLDEGSLSRPIGGAEVMAEQLRRLLEATRAPHVTIQIVPLGANPGLSGAIVVAHAANAQRHTVYLETAAEPVVTSAPETVATVTVKLDAIRAGAYPLNASIEFIGKVLERWTSGPN